MIRVVLDTNVVVSALAFRGVANQLVFLWKIGRLLPLVSKEMVEEYLKVLAYPKFRLTEERIKFLVERQFLAFAQPVEIKEVPKVIKEDPSDDVFLACAYFGKAQYVVSGDKHLLNLKSHHGIPIVSITSFLDCLPKEAH